MVRPTPVPPEEALPAARWIFHHISTTPAAPLAAAIVGPGGTGKSAVLDAVAREYAKANVSVVRGRPKDDGWLDFEADGPPVLVDDAHDLSEPDLHRLRALAGTGTVRLVVTYRPWPKPPGLSALGAGLSRQHSPVMVSHLDRDGIAARIAARVDCVPGEALVDLVHEQAGGLPWLADLVTQALLDTGRFDPHHPEEFRRPRRVNVSPALAERLRYQLETLDPRVYDLLRALAIGAELDGEVLAPLLHTDVAEVTQTAEAARATGLLTDSGELIAFIRNLVLRLTPTLARRKMQRQLADIQLERGGPVLETGQQLLGTGASGAHVAAVMTAAGDEALGCSPRLAGELFAEAVSAGSPSRPIAARRAQAAALIGEFDEALRHADEVLSDPQAPDHARGISVTAAVLAHRGLPARSAQLYSGLPEEAAFAVPVLIGTGALPQARALFESLGENDRATPTLLNVAATLMAAGMLASVESTYTAALSELARAAAILEPAGETALLPDTPAALTAIVAMQCGELSVADSTLRRAIATKLGGRPAHTRHLLLHGWLAMTRGKFDLARRALDRSGSGSALEPRDELLAAALTVGLARRSDDPTATRAGLRRARTALVRHPVDLYTLAPLGELAVAASEHGEWDWLAPHLDEAETLLDQLGNPPLWTTALLWHRLQAAVVTADLSAAEQHVKTLSETATNNPNAAALAGAGRCWLSIAQGVIDAEFVQDTAQRLHRVGLAADGARLAGQAAAATTDRRIMTTLLACARSLSGGAGTLHDSPGYDDHRSERPTDAHDEESGTTIGRKPAASTSGTSGPISGKSGRTPAAEHPISPKSAHVDNVHTGGAALSERELEVGGLILAGLTYKNIGERLFISAKTVEHHVARMRQRLGVSSRTELFAELRALTGEAGAAGPARA